MDREFLQKFSTSLIKKANDLFIFSAFLLGMMTLTRLPLS